MLNTVHCCIVLFLCSPVFKPHLRGRRSRVKVVHVIYGLLFLVPIGSAAHVSTLVPVCADMFAQRGRFFEGAVAVGAAARPLSSVNELVMLEVLQSAQALAADATDVRFLTGMCAPVFA